jgi:ubiquitin-protein ligase
MNLNLSKETIVRLLHDVKQIIKSPLTENGIFYSHDDTNMLKGYAMIVGPKDTPYFGGFYLFEFLFPNNYPYAPPKVTYLTNDGYTRFHPNLYVSGKTCLSVLNTWRGEQWSSCQTLSTILLTLLTLFTKDPLLNEPGVTKNHRDLKEYTSIIEYENISFAICNVVSKNVRCSSPAFSIFYPDICKYFIENYDTIHKFVTDNKGIIQKCKTDMYCMNNIVDYDILLTKLNDTKTNFDISYKK